MTNLRAALEAMVREYGDYHYHTCPADNDSGDCNCFAGAIADDARAALAAAPPADAERMRRALELKPFTWKAIETRLYEACNGTIWHTAEEATAESQRARSALVRADNGKESEGCLPPDWKQDQAETTRIKPKVSDPMPAQERSRCPECSSELSTKGITTECTCCAWWVENPALPPPKNERPSQEWDEIALALQRVERECLSLKCCDVGWEIVEHRMTRPRERMVAHGKTPIEALRALRHEPGGR